MAQLYEGYSMWAVDDRLPDFSLCYSEAEACQPRRISKPLAASFVDAGAAAEAVDIAVSQPVSVDPRVAFVKRLRCLTDPFSGMWEQNASIPLCMPERQGPDNAWEYVVQVCPVNVSV